MRTNDDAFSATVFFDVVRARGGVLGHGGRLTAEQVEGAEAILRASAGLRADETAYLLATAWWETARTLQPIAERGGDAYFREMYDPAGKRPELARRMGNTAAGDGKRYRGRGYVQLTWKVNYEKAGRALGVDLVANPDLAMRPDIAAVILRRGMVEGWFTGKKLADYFGAGRAPDFRNARRIINGTDRAADIARLAEVFLDALRAGDWGRTYVRAPAPVSPAPPKPAPKQSPGGFFAWLLSLFRRSS